LVRLINTCIFTLNFEIVPAVWVFIFVYIDQYISLSPHMPEELYVRFILYISLLYILPCVKCDVMITLILLLE